MTLQYVEPAALKGWLHDGMELALFDVREHGLYGAEHLLFAIPLPYSRLEHDIARLAPRKQTRIALVDDDESVASRAARRLAAIGYDSVHVLRGGNRAWREAGYSTFAGVNVPSKLFGELVELSCHTPRVSAAELSEMLSEKRNLVVLDGRPYSEYQKMNIPGAICCPNGELAYRVHELVPDEDTTIVINCAGRTRSIIGAQTLINLGLKNPVFALENGTQGWYLQDFALENGSGRKYPEVAGGEGLEQARARSRALASRLSVPYVQPTEVSAWQSQNEVTVFLCDVRSSEEYAAGSLPGAQHTPGGQLIQATDQYVGVRGARLVVFDSDGVRAPVIAGWLRQLGHDAYVLRDGLDAARGALSEPAPAQQLPRDPLLGIAAAELRRQLEAKEVIVVDVRASASYREAHIPGAVWSIRPLISEQFANGKGPVVFVADDPVVATLAASELAPQRPAYLLRGGLRGWEECGYECASTPELPPDTSRIDYLFFTHDRHDGNKEAARQYLAWELGLLAQIDDQDLSTFAPVVLQTEADLT